MLLQQVYHVSFALSFFFFFFRYIPSAESKLMTKLITKLIGFGTKLLREGIVGRVLSADLGHSPHGAYRVSRDPHMAPHTACGNSFVSSPAVTARRPSSRWFGSSALTS